MIKERIENLRKKLSELDIDGYVIPKNDEFFSEYAEIDRLKFISNFSGSAGYAVILKNKNYLFVDGRYTIQAKIESGEYFKIIDYHKILNCNLFKKLTIGLNPKFFTSDQIKKFFLKNNKIELIDTDLISQHSKNNKTKKRFFSISQKDCGEHHTSKINKISILLKKLKAKLIFISAPENVAWLLNIRGYDNPNSPIPNCHLLLDNEKKIYLIANKTKTQKLVHEKKLRQKQIINFKELDSLLKKNYLNKRIIIDRKTCSLFYENLLKKKLKVHKKDDPIYLLKSIKNKVEINNMIKAHIHDGVALTKFIFWIKNINKSKITEFDAQNKLENFRKKNKNYLYPSFNTIAGTGSNGAIVHYRATKKNSKTISKKQIFLCDSGGQYKFGTTDVTRTICFSKPKKIIKDIFTKVLKGHIAVVTTNLNKIKTGNLIDKRARKFLNNSNLDYPHGTGHGVGYFLNVHEGPQAISKFNKVLISEGMILSNEPGFYKKGHFGIRIENLIYVKKSLGKLFFENLTLAPIDKDLIDFNKLTQTEKNYLLNYNLDIYSKLFKFLSKSEKKWLVSLI